MIVRTLLLFAFFLATVSCKADAKKKLDPNIKVTCCCERHDEGQVSFHEVPISECSTNQGRCASSDKCEARPDAGAEKSEPVKSFTSDGIPNLKLGQTIEQADVEAAFDTDDVQLENETAEGEVIGRMYVVKRGKKLIAYARVDGTNTLRSLEFYALNDQEGVAPGTTSYEDADDILHFTDCLGGIEDSAEEVLCLTNDESVKVGFQSTIETAEKSLDRAYMEKHFAKTKVKYMLISK